MKTIWKYEMQVLDDVTIQVPVGAEMLGHVHAPNPARLWVWFEVDSDVEERQDITFRIIGTGNPAEPDPGTRLEYVGTAVADVHAVWHLYLVFAAVAT